MLRCAITDRTLFAPSSARPYEALAARCGMLAAEGIEILLIRERDLAAGALVSLCRRILSAVRQAGPHTRILVAGHPDIALAAALDGVHLSSGPEQLTPAEIRTLYVRAGVPPPFVTVSCHTLEEIRRARQQQVDAALFAPVFGKTLLGKPVTDPVGLEALAAACRAAGPMPVLALGGVTGENTSQCLAAGATGVAAIRLFMRP